MLVLVNGVYEAVLLGKQTRRHAWPACEYNKRKQIAGHKCAAHATEDGRRRVLVEVDHEAERCRDVNVGVDLVQTVHYERMRHDELLHSELDADSKAALEVKDLDAVLAGDPGRLLFERQGGHSSANLIHLIGSVSIGLMQKQRHLPSKSTTSTTLPSRTGSMPETGW
jgi:hypothetical protein